MCTCVPPPLSRIARRALKARSKRWLGPSDTPPRAARVPTPPQALINRIGCKYSGGPLVYSYTRMRQYSPIGI